MYLSDFQSISIFSLQKHICFDQDQKQRVAITWGETKGVDVLFGCIKGKRMIVIEYSYLQQPRKQAISLTSIPNNIHSGKDYFFVCPLSGTRCRKLHFLKGRFVHRSVEKEYLYQLQAESKKRRDRLREAEAKRKLLTENPLDQIHKKHYPLSYNGRPTRRVLRLKKELQKFLSRLSEGDIEKLGFRE